MGDLWSLWIGLGALLGVGERLTTRLYFGPAALGTLAAGVAAASRLSLSVQGGAFAVVTLTGLALRGRLLVPYQRAAARSRAGLRSATVVEGIGGHAGRVRYGGREWMALSPGHYLPPGTKVMITGLADEVTLRVSPKDTVRQAVAAARAAPLQQVSWRQASNARRKLHGGGPLTPGERLRLLELIRRRRRYGDRLWGRFMLSMAGVFSAGILAVGWLGLVPAIRAAQGQGVRGVFIARTLSCERTCQWTGTFTSPGQLVPGAVYDDKLPASTHPGSIVPALYPGNSGSKEVFAVHGSTAWLIYLLIMPLAAAGLAASLWLGPIRYLRRRTQARSPAS